MRMRFSPFVFARCLVFFPFFPIFDQCALKIWMVFVFVCFFFIASCLWVNLCSLLPAWRSAAWRVQCKTDQPYVNERTHAFHSQWPSLCLPVCLPACQPYWPWEAGLICHSFIHLFLRYYWLCIRLLFLLLLLFCATEKQRGVKKAWTIIMYLLFSNNKNIIWNDRIGSSTSSLGCFVIFLFVCWPFDTYICHFCHGICVLCEYGGSLRLCFDAMCVAGFIVLLFVFARGCVPGGKICAIYSFVPTDGTKMCGVNRWFSVLLICCYIVPAKYFRRSFSHQASSRSADAQVTVTHMCFSSRLPPLIIIKRLWLTAAHRL